LTNVAQSVAPDALLRFADVTLRRGGRLLVEALDLVVRPGERLVLTGPNGSGKSSLLRLAAGLLRPDGGRVERAQVALADDAAAFDRELPLIAALEFWLDANGYRRRLGGAIEALDLAQLAHVPVRLLSAGQLKRATLARAAGSTAPLWLLDEPTNGLDAQGLGHLSELVAAHTSAGGAVVAASHVELPGEWRRLEPGA